MSEYIYGKNVSKQRLQGKNDIQTISMLDTFKDRDILNLIEHQHIEVKRVSKKALDALVGHDKHQGIVLEVPSYNYASLEDIKQNTKQEYPLIIMLDGLEDPHNLGAVLRTADAIGANGIVIGKHRSVELNATVAKVSTGAIDTVPVCKVTNLAKTLSQLKKEGYWVVGADMDTHAKCYDEPDYQTPLVLVIGSEGNGISTLVRKNCDYFVYLPMEGSVTSLNASVASAILMYEIKRKRKG